MIEAMSEIINEIDTSVKNISSQSTEHIHANEVILTMGKSGTVEAFLKVSGKKAPININSSSPFKKNFNG